MLIRPHQTRVEAAALTQQPSPPLHGYASFAIAAPGRSFSQAEAFCNGRGGTLAQVASAEANAAVVAVMPMTTIAWIGGEETREGVWIWTSGGGSFPPTPGRLAFAYSNWASGEDLDAAGPQCVAMDSSNGKWLALDCAEKRQHIVCQEIAPCFCRILHKCQKYQFTPARLLSTSIIDGVEPLRTYAAITSCQPSCGYSLMSTYGFSLSV